MAIPNTLRDRLEAHIKNPSNKTTALVVEGGGMRGVYSMGALAHLEKTGLSNAFDYVIGSSAGAINGAYLLAGQAVDAVKVYTDYLSNKHFVNLLRVSKIVDIDYMVDDVLKKMYPLAIASVQNSPSILEIILTDAFTAKQRIVTNRDKGIDLYEAIRATAALPGLYNEKVQVGQKFYIDGGLTNTVPLQRAMELTPDLTVVVSTQRYGFRKKAVSPIERMIFRLFSRGQSRAVLEFVGGGSVLYNEALNLLENKNREFNLYGVWPSDMNKMVKRTTRKRNELMACAVMGELDMCHTLNNLLYS